jgi:hypothetical protein
MIDLFPVKILERPRASFLAWVVVSTAINLAIMFAFAFAITAGIIAAYKGGL